MAEFMLSTANKVVKILHIYPTGVAIHVTHVIECFSSIFAYCKSPKTEW